MRDKILIVGHVRSGHHLLAESIMLNTSYRGFFWMNVSAEELNGAKKRTIYKNHGFPSWHRPCMGHLREHFHIFVPVRDGRDVMVSTFHFKKGHTKSRIPEGMTFSEFLRAGSFLENWVRHVEGWMREDWVHLVRYEDMVQNFHSTFDRILGILDEPLMAYPKRPKLGDPITPNNIQRKGMVGDWRNHFTKEDSVLFWSVAGPTMVKLGY